MPRRTSALLVTTALAAAPLAAQEGDGPDSPIDAADIVPLNTWTYDELYAEGLSAERFIDEMQVEDPSGERIGDMEDIILNPEGEIVSIVAEVGGVWDIGDTHVSVPYEQIEILGESDTVRVPITEETVADFGMDPETFAPQTMADQSVPGLDDESLAPRAWRATEMIGDYARLRDGERLVNYGYVSDLILQDGAVEAVVVQPNAAYGAVGYRAYPYYGSPDGAGWSAGSPYYDMPYRLEDLGKVETFDYGDLSS